MVVNGNARVTWEEPGTAIHNHLPNSNNSTGEVVNGVEGPGVQ